MSAACRNDRSTLRRRRSNTSPMAAYDRLPPELRSWVSQAALPWSAQSVLRLWRKTLTACDGDTAEAKRHLSRIEHRHIGQDARRIWGDAHPAAAPTPERGGDVTPKTGTNHGNVTYR